MVEHGGLGRVRCLAVVVDRNGMKELGADSGFQSGRSLLDQAQAEMGKLTGGLNLPFKLPFGG